MKQGVIKLHVQLLVEGLQRLALFPVQLRESNLYFLSNYCIDQDQILAEKIIEIVRKYKTDASATFRPPLQNYVCILKQSHVH